MMPLFIKVASLLVRMVIILSRQPMNAVKNILIAFLVTGSILCRAQVGTEGDSAVFRVKKPAGSTIKLLPETDVLYKNYPRKFKLIKPAGFNMDSVEFREGSVKLTDSTIAIRPTKFNTALLKIYEKTESGRSLAYMKEFRVINLPAPKPNLDGVGNDSIIPRMKAVAMGNLYVPSETDDMLKSALSYKIISYELSMSGINESMSGLGNRLTYAMRDKIDQLEDGSVLQFSNIKYEIDGDVFDAAPFRVYIRVDKTSKF